MLGGDICLVSCFSKIHFVKTIIFPNIPAHRKGIWLQVDHLRLCYQIAFTWPCRFYVVALFRIGVFIESSLLFSWSMSRVRFAQRVWGLLYFVFVFVWFDLMSVWRLEMSRCGEHATVLPCRLVCLNVITSAVRHRFSRRRLLVGTFHPRRIQMKENPLASSAPFVCLLVSIFKVERQSARRVTVSQRCLREHAGWDKTPDQAAFQRALLSIHRLPEAFVQTPAGATLTSHFSAHVSSCHPPSSALCSTAGSAPATSLHCLPVAVQDACITKF